MSENVPIIEKLFTDEELRLIRSVILQELWDAEEKNKPEKCFFFQPSCGRFLYNDEYISPQVGEALIDNDLAFEGFVPHQNEIMVCYRLVDRLHAQSKTLDYFHWYGSELV